MPKIYRYLGIIIEFHSREHKPIHVHGRKAGRELKAEFIIIDGIIDSIKYKTVRGKERLKKTDIDDFQLFVDTYKNQILQKWIDYFVLNKVIDFEKIDEKIG